MPTAKKAAKDFAKTSRGLAGRELMESYKQEANDQAAMQFGMGGLLGLGTEGTYDTPITGAAGTNAAGQVNYSPSGSGGGAGSTPPPNSHMQTLALPNDVLKISKGNLVDPNNRQVLDSSTLLAGAKASPIYRMYSRDVAEMNAAVDPSSPFRQALDHSIMNPILEAGANTLRESQAAIQRGMQKGGTAAANAAKMATQAANIAATNFAVGSELSDKTMKLEMWIRERRNALATGAGSFIDSFGVKKYADAMNATSQWMQKVAIPTAGEFAAKTYDVEMANRKKGTLEMVLGGIASVVGLVVSAYSGNAQGVAASLQGVSTTLGGAPGAAPPISGGLLSGGNDGQKWFGFGGGSSSVPGTPGAPTIGSNLMPGGQLTTKF